MGHAPDDAASRLQSWDVSPGLPDSHPHHVLSNLPEKGYSQDSNPGLHRQLFITRLYPLPKTASC